MSGASEHLVPGDGHGLSAPEFARTAGLREEEVRELEDYHLLPAGPLDLPTALALREAVRLRSDFDLDLFTTGLLAGYLRRIADLQGEVQRLRAQMGGRAVYTEVSYTAVEVRRR